LNDNFKLRKANLSDIAGIQSCVNAAYSFYKDDNDLLPEPLFDDYHQKITSDHFLVIDNNTHIAAILVLVLKKSYLLLDNIAVHPNFQKNGLGRYLLDVAEIEALKLDYKEIQLYTNAKMTNNLQIYTHIGYSEFTRRQESGFHRVYFRKAL